MKRRLRFFWRTLWNRWIHPDTSINSKCLLINEEAEMMAEALGIDNERLEELLAIMGNSIKDKNDKKIRVTLRNMADLLIETSVHSKHPNELALISFVLGQTYESMSNPMIRMFGGMIK